MSVELNPRSPGVPADGKPGPWSQPHMQQETRKVWVTLNLRLWLRTETEAHLPCEQKPQTCRTHLLPPGGRPAVPVTPCTLSPTAWLASGTRGSGRGQTVDTLLSQTSAPRAGPQHNVWKADSCKPLKHMCHMSCMCVRSRVSCVVHVPCVTGLGAAVAQNIILLSSLPSARCPHAHVLALYVWVGGCR